MLQRSSTPRAGGDRPLLQPEEAHKTCPDPRGLLGNRRLEHDALHRKVGVDVAAHDALGAIGTRRRDLDRSDEEPAQVNRAGCRGRAATERAVAPAPPGGATRAGPARPAAWWGAPLSVGGHAATGVRGGGAGVSALRRFAAVAGGDHGAGVDRAAAERAPPGGPCRCCGTWVWRTRRRSWRRHVGRLPMRGGG